MAALPVQQAPLSSHRQKTRSSPVTNGAQKQLSYQGSCFPEDERSEGDRFIASKILLALCERSCLTHPVTGRWTDLRLGCDQRERPGDRAYAGLSLGEFGLFLEPIPGSD